MATISASPSSIPDAGTWATTTNVYTSNNTYATNTGTTQNTEYPFDIGGFNFAGIPAWSTINSITVTVEAKVSNASRAQIKGELYDDTTLLTGSLAYTSLTTTDANYTFTPTATLAQLQSSTLKVRVTNKRIVSQATTTSIDYVKIDVVYTPPSGRPKVWNGTAWVQKPAKVWNGSTWVEKPVKVWTGSAWKTVT